MNNGQVSSSFRDPSGFLFFAEDGQAHGETGDPPKGWGVLKKFGQSSECKEIFIA